MSVVLLSNQSIEWSAWLDHVLPEVPGCPDVKALLEIQNAAIEFLQRSWVWIYDHPIVTIPPVTDPPTIVFNTPAVYPFVPPNIESVVHMITAMWFLPPNGGKRRLYPKGRDHLWEMNSDFPSWAAPVPLYYTHPSEPFTSYGFGFQLVPFVNRANAGQLRLQCALVPTRAAAGLPQWVFERYLEEIKYGALWRIKASMGKSYTDEAGAGAYKGLFTTAYKNAFQDGTRNFTRDTEQTFSLARR